MTAMLDQIASRLANSVRATEPVALPHQDKVAVVVPITTPAGLQMMDLLPTAAERCGMTVLGLARGQDAWAAILEPLPDDRDRYLADSTDAAMSVLGDAACLAAGLDLEERAEGALYRYATTDEGRREAFAALRDNRSLIAA